MASNTPSYQTAHLDEAGLKQLIQLIKGSVDGLNATDDTLKCAVAKLKEEVGELWLDHKTGIKKISYDADTNTLIFELATGAKTYIKLNDFTDQNVVQRKLTSGERRLLLTGVKTGDQTQTTTTTFASDVTYNADNKSLNAKKIVVDELYAKQIVTTQEVEDMFTEIREKFEDYDNLYSVEVTSDGGCEVFGSGIYASGETVLISAVARSGYKFKQWDNGETEQSFEHTVHGDAVFSAITEEIVDPLVTRTAYIQNYDEAGNKRVSAGFTFEDNDEGSILVHLFRGGNILLIDEIKDIVDPQFIKPYEELDVFDPDQYMHTFEGKRYDFKVAETGDYRFTLKRHTENTWSLTKE